MNDYEHTQAGTWMRAVLGGGAVVTGGIAAAMALGGWGPAWPAAAVAATLLLTLALFSSLTVTVTADAIALRFGVGVVRKRFATAEVDSAAVVRNRWWYGWGVKLTPHGWLFNVSGLDAVEIRMRNGRKYRIGTDQPAKLLAAIEAAIDVARTKGRE